MPPERSLTFTSVSNSHIEGRTGREKGPRHDGHPLPRGEKRLVVVSGAPIPELARDVASELGTEVLSSTASTSANGETYVRFNESVRGCDVFVAPVPRRPRQRLDSWMQLILVDALKR